MLSAGSPAVQLARHGEAEDAGADDDDVALAGGAQDAAPAPEVEHLAAQVDEAPAVDALVEPQEQHAEVPVLAPLAVRRARLCSTDGAFPPVPTTNWRMPVVVAQAVLVLRGEPLVVVVVARSTTSSAPPSISARQNGMLRGSLPWKPEL